MAHERKHALGGCRSVTSQGGMLSIRPQIHCISFTSRWFGRIGNYRQQPHSYFFFNLNSNYFPSVRLIRRPCLLFISARSVHISRLKYKSSSYFVFLLTFRHRASCILGQAFRYSPENAFYIFNQQIYFII